MKRVLCLLLVFGMLFSFSACKPSGVHSDISWKIEDGVLTVDGDGDGLIGDFCTDTQGLYTGTCYDSSAIPWYGLDYHTLVLGKGITYVSQHAFADAASLQKVIIQAERVEIEHGAFQNCSNLQEVENSERIAEMGEGAFENCSSLKSITLGEGFSFMLPSLPNLPENEFGSWFDGCSALESIEIDEDNSFIESCDGVVYTDDMDTLIYYPMGKPEKTFVIPETVDKIYQWAFARAEHLEEITITGCRVMAEAFWSCPVLKTVVVGNDASIGPSCFEQCSALESFRVDGDHPWFTVMDGVLYDSSQFETVGELTLFCYPDGKKEKSFTVPKEVTQIQQNAFAGSGYLEYVDFAGEGITVIDPGVFRKCTSLKAVILPKSVTTIGEEAFYECTSLANVELPEGTTTIGKRAFGDCTSLERIQLPESVTSMGESAFSRCKSLKTIKIPGSISTIESNVFFRCAALETVEISEGANKISSDVFRECESLKTIIIAQSVTEISEFAFKEVPGDITILCPKGSAAEEYAKSHGIRYTIQET